MVLTLILGKVYGYRHRERQRERVRRRRRRRRRRSRLGCGEKRRGPTMLVTSPHARLWLHVAMVMLICGLGVVAWFSMGEGATWAYVIGWQLSEVGLSWLTPTTPHTHTHTHIYTLYTFTFTFTITITHTRWQIKLQLSAEQGRYYYTICTYLYCEVWSWGMIRDDGGAPDYGVWDPR